MPIDAAVAPDAALPPIVSDLFVGANVRYPTRLALASDGARYLSDAVAGRVVGVRAGRIALDLRGLDRPLGIAVVGERLLVGSTGRGSVEIYDRRDGSWLGALGAGAGEVVMPNAIAVAPDQGRIYVVDSRADRVNIYGPDGVRLGSFGGSGTASGQFRFPAAIAVDDVRVAVVDQTNHRVQLFDRDGGWQQSIGLPPPSSAPSLEAYRGTLSRAQGVALLGDEIAVLDATFGTVQLFGNDGQCRGFVGGRGSCPDCVDLALDLAWDPVAAELLVSDPLHQRVLAWPAVTRWLP